MTAETPTQPPAIIHDVQVLTRWHQAGVILAFAVLGPALAFLLFWLGLENDWNIVVLLVGVLACIALPPLLVFRSYRIADRVQVTADGLRFENRVPISFGELAAYNTDDYLKLTLRGGSTLLVQAKGKTGQASYKQFIEQFVASAKRWKRNRAQAGQPPSLERRHFYGSPAARMLGAAMLLCSIGIIAGILILPRPPYGVLGPAIGGMIFGCVLLLRKP